MKLFPDNAPQQLEFTKIKTLLEYYCRSEYAILKANVLRIHTRKEFIEPELCQTYEYKLVYGLMRRERYLILFYPKSSKPLITKKPSHN